MFFENKDIQKVNVEEELQSKIPDIKNIKICLEVIKDY